MPWRCSFVLKSFLLISIHVLWNCDFLLCQISITSWFWPLGTNRFKFSLRYFKIDLTFQDQLNTHWLPTSPLSSTIFKGITCLIPYECWKDAISFFKKLNSFPMFLIFESLTKGPLNAYCFHNIFLPNIFQAIETNLQWWDLIIVPKLCLSKCSNDWKGKVLCKYR